MKISKLHLLAYGPFTDHVIDFNSGSNGLHFIYGPNEAGKSSALRALKHLFYGIPQRCSDDFLHPYNKMRIGAELKNSAGEILNILRRKGRSNTLRALDDKTVVEEAALNRFIKGVDLDLFTTLFGIDYEELNQGGEQIISGGGNLGKLLFSAGSGIADLSVILNELQGQADLLFKRAAQKPAINAALSEFNATQKDLREAQLPGRKWNEHDRALRGALARMEQLEQSLKEGYRELNRLERIKAALPIIAQRTQLLTERESVADAVILPADFASKRHKLGTALEVALSARGQSMQRIEDLTQKIQGSQVPEALLAVDKDVDNFYRELGSLQKADKDRLLLKTRYSTLMAEARDGLKRLRKDLALEEVETLRIQKTDIILINELGITCERLNTRKNSLYDERLRLERQFAANQAQKKKLAKPRDLNTLKSALDQAEEHSSYESYCREEELKIAAAMKTLQANIAKLGLWSGTPQQLERLTIPSLESISVAEARLESLHRKLDGLTEKHLQAEDRKRELEGQISALQMERRVPTVKDLDDIRAKREEGWQLLLAGLNHRPSDDRLAGKYLDQFPGAISLFDAYETAVRKADEIADRLRHEADSVAMLAKLSAEKTLVTKQIERFKKDIASVKNSLGLSTNQWKELWRASNILPLSPKEMRSWSHNQKSLAERAQELRERQSRVDNMTARVNEHREKLSRYLSAFGKAGEQDPSSLLAQIKQSRRLIESEEAKRTLFERNEADAGRLGEELDMVRSKIDRLEADLIRWQEDWGKAMLKLGLDKTALPRQANAVIDETQKLFHTLKDAHILKQRIDGIGRDEESFTRNVNRLIGQVATDLGSVSTHEAVMVLHQRLTQARSAYFKLQSRQDELKTEQRRLSKIDNEIVELRARLGTFCQQAGCSDYKDLPLAEKRSENRCRIEAKLTELDQSLNNLSAGAGIKEFITQVRNVDADAISQTIASLKESNGALDLEKNELNQTIGRERNELSKMDGSARAAELAENVQLLLGRLQEDICQYARVKFAWVVLNRAMERFRDKNQGPILSHASDIFAKLSCGSFGGIRADFDEKGEPVIVGVRPEGKDVVGVDAMSDGTADQLYLSLRLAGLWDYLKRNDPMPLIVDDILIQFDDMRANAALNALAELSQKTQVIFFSHHYHLLELAQKSLPQEMLIIHRL